MKVGKRIFRFIAILLPEAVLQKAESLPCFVAGNTRMKFCSEFFG
jgi:hypothetical protein